MKKYISLILLCIIGQIYSMTDVERKKNNLVLVSTALRDASNKAFGEST